MGSRVLLCSVLLAICSVTEAQIAGSSKCLTAKHNALNTLRNSRQPVFVPRCQEDGLFEAIQVNDFTGLAWCVDVITGEKVDGTTTRGMPNCFDTSSSTEEVCPRSSTYKQCSPLLCAFTCANFGPYYYLCLVNPCGDQCVPEFFDRRNSQQVYCTTQTDCEEMALATLPYIRDQDPDQYIDQLIWWFNSREYRSRMTTPARGPSTTTLRMLTTSTPSGLPGPRGPMTFRPTGPTTTPRPLPARPPSVIVDLVAGVTMPTCSYSGEAENKQCHGDLCWCVDSGGSPVDHTMVIGELTCTQSGIDPYNSGGNPVECNNGALPYPCPDACQTASCNHPNQNIKCHASICQNCEVIFTDETGQEVTCLPEGDCSWVEASDWYFSDSEIVCTQNFAGDDCAAITFYKTRTDCVWKNHHKFAVNVECGYPCLGQTCRRDSGAICVVDYTDCSTFFIDAGDNIVDCPTVKGVCERHVDSKISQGLTGNLPECDDLGNYASTQCNDTRTCWCVDKRGLEIPNSRHDLEDDQRLECGQLFPCSIHGSLTFRGTYVTMTFKRQVKSVIEAAINTMVERIDANVQAENTVVDYRISVDNNNGRATTTTLAEVDTMTLAANRGEFVTRYEDKTLRATAASYSLDYRCSDSDSDPEDQDLPPMPFKGPGVIALIIICIVAFFAIVWGCVAWCRKEKKREMKSTTLMYNARYPSQGPSHAESSDMGTTVYHNAAYVDSKYQ